MPRKKLKPLRIKFLDIPKELITPREVKPEKNKSVNKKYKNLRIAKLKKTLAIDETISIDTNKPQLMDINHKNENFHFQDLNFEKEKQITVDQKITVDKYKETQNINLQENQFDTSTMNDNDNTDQSFYQSFDSFLNFFS